MRTVFYMICSAIVITLAYWAYKENYNTQTALREVNELQQKIAIQKEAIAVLNAEWAYLNRPERLRELVDMNFEDLQLIPLMPSHFGDSEMVGYPTEQQLEVVSPVSATIADVNLSGAGQ